MILLGRRLDLVLPPRSLLVLQNEARYVWTHCIPPRSTDTMEDGTVVRREPRLSLTLRRLRRADEGPCTCTFGGVWCDSLKSIDSSSIDINTSNTNNLEEEDGGGPPAQKKHKS